MKRIGLLVLILAALAGASKAQIAAYPGAMGGGAAANPGRQGVVYNVNTLDDNTHSGCQPNSTTTCSLRDCIQASGARICVFRVAGMISQQARLQIFNPNLYIAGQTAPGDGITLGGPNGYQECLWVSTHDVVIRYLSYSGDNKNFATGPDSGTGCFETASSPNIFNVIYDHLTARWYGNKSFAFLNNNASNQGIRNMTYSYNLVYEPICYQNANGAVSCHPVGSLGTDSTGGSALLVNDIDFHHNMIAAVDHRSPLVQGSNRVRWVNNISYIFNQFAGLLMGGIQMDWIGNKWVDGNLRDFNGQIGLDNVHPILGERGDNPSDLSDNCSGGNPCTNPGPPLMYMVNNVGRSTPTPFSTPIPVTNVVNDSGQKSLTSQGTEAGDLNSAMPSSWFRSTPNPTEQFPIVAEPVTNIDNSVLPEVGQSHRLDCNGNMVSNRNIEDQRIISTYQAKGVGQLYFFQRVDPTIATGSPCQESMNDGIPDQWKVLKGLSTTDPNLYKALAPNNYTWLENYLNGPTTTGGGGGGTVIPALTITNISVTNVTSNSATINWTTNNPANSTVNYGVCNNLLPTVTNPNQVTSHSVNLTGLSAGTQYTFNVESFDGTTTLLSASQVFTTLAAPPVSNPTQPAAPVLLQLSQPIQAFQLTWTASPSSGVTQYKVYRSTTQGTGYVQKAIVTTNIWIDTAVTSGQKFFYVVTAVAPGDTTPESAFSNELSVVIP